MWEHNPTVEHNKHQIPPSDINLSLFPVLWTLRIHFLNIKFKKYDYGFSFQAAKNYLHKERTPRT